MRESGIWICQVPGHDPQCWILVSELKDAFPTSLDVITKTKPQFPDDIVAAYKAFKAVHYKRKAQLGFHYRKYL